MMNRIPDWEGAERMLVATIADQRKELAALRGQVSTLRDACRAVMAYVDVTGWGDLALAGTGDKGKDTLAEAAVQMVRAALAATAAPQDTEARHE